MNETRMRQAMEGVTSIAQRVLEAVPIQEPWSKAQIVAELKRTGSSASVEVVHGCLNNLRGKGLISEPESGKFIRVQARKKQPAAEQPQDVKETMTAPAPEPKVETDTALDRLAKLSGELIKRAAEIEEIALDVAQQIERVQADSEKLRQLQALLKGLGT